MHNLEPLVKGKESCTAHVHSDDRRAPRSHERRARVRSRVGEIDVQVEVTDGVMPGVVSVPHSWGHDVDGIRMSVATAHPGANSNALADETLIDALSGNAVRNGVPVKLEPA